MKHQKPLIVKIIIWICVLMMVLSLIGVYIGSMSSQNGAGENTDGVNTGDIQEISGDVQVIDEILPEVNPDEPDNTSAPILVTEDGEIDEMDRTIEVQLENGETEVVRQGDLSDVIQLNQ